MSEKDNTRIEDQELENEALAAGEAVAEAEKKSAVPAKKDSDKAVKKANKKPGLGSRITKWFRELRSEAKKVIWPTRKQVVNNTIVVIVMVIIVSAFVALLDTTFGFARDFLARIVS